MARKLDLSDFPYMAGQHVRPGAIVQVQPYREKANQPCGLAENLVGAEPLRLTVLAFGTLWVVRGLIPELARQILGWSAFRNVELVSPTTGAVFYVQRRFMGSEFFRIISDGST